MEQSQKTTSLKILNLIQNPKEKPKPKNGYGPKDDNAKSKGNNNKLKEKDNGETKTKESNTKSSSSKNALPQQQTDDPLQSLCDASEENCLPIDSNGITRCPVGTHRSPSGICEKPIDNTGKPPCPIGQHRSPSGDCESDIPCTYSPQGCPTTPDCTKTPLPPGCPTTSDKEYIYNRYSYQILYYKSNNPAANN